IFGVVARAALLFRRGRESIKLNQGQGLSFRITSTLPPLDQESRSVGEDRSGPHPLKSCRGGHADSRADEGDTLATGPHSQRKAPNGRRVQTGASLRQVTEIRL